MGAPRDIFDRAHAYVEHCRRHYTGQPRRASLCIAWWGILHSLARRKAASGLQGSTLRVALMLDGGMGDVLLHIRYVKDLCAQCGPFSLDIYTPFEASTVRPLFAGVDFVEGILQGRPEQPYDLVLYSLFVPMTVTCDEKRFAELASPALKSYAASLERFKARNPQWFSYQEYCKADILNYARVTETRRGLLPYMTGDLRPEAAESLQFDLPDPAFPWGDRPFVTISRGVGAGRESTKLWPEHRYGELMQLLRAQFPGIIFVQTGREHEAKLDADCDLRGKTSFKELAALMRGAALHISSEGGPVHLRHLLQGGPSLVFFGPTDPAFYGYPENCNLRTQVCTPCEWVQRDWQKQCLRGFGHCRALDSLEASAVVQKIMKHPQISEALCKMR